MRWRLHLAEFNFEVNYKEGTLNTQADALSCIPTQGEALSQSEGETIPCFFVLYWNRIVIYFNPNCDPSWVKGTYLAK